MTDMKSTLPDDAATRSASSTVTSVHAPEETTSTRGAGSEHGATLEKILSEDIPLKRRARRLITLVSKHPDAVWANKELAGRALETISEGLDNARVSELSDNWEDADFRPRVGGLWKLCELSLKVQSLLDAFRENDKEKLVSCRKCDDDEPCSKCDNDEAVSKLFDTLLMDFFQPWNLIDRAMAKSGIEEEWRRDFVRRRCDLRQTSNLNLATRYAFSELDISDTAPTLGRQDGAHDGEQEEDNDDFGDRSFIADLRARNRQLLSPKHFDPKAEVLRGPETTNGGFLL